MPERGVYIVAYGGPARKCATRAVRSLREHMPGLPVAVASTAPLGEEDVFVEHPEVDVGARAAKTLIYDLAPQDWQYILYLDADTEVIADISPLFRFVEDGWDLAICKNPVRFHVIRNMTRPDNEDECAATFRLLGSQELLQFNGGVFSFRRNERTAAFFRAWHAEWQRWGKRDQAALLRALWANPLRLFVLTNAWNTVTAYAPVSSSAGILHRPQTARRWNGIIDGRADSKEAWARVRGGRG